MPIWMGMSWRFGGSEVCAKLNIAFPQLVEEAFRRTEGATRPYAIDRIKSFAYYIHFDIRMA